MWLPVALFAVAAVFLVVVALLWYPSLKAGSIAVAPRQPFLNSYQVSPKVDVNAAAVEELAVLPGIGEGRAQAIIDYREEHGPFTSLEGLLQVKGVGEKILEGLREHADV